MTLKEKIAYRDAMQEMADGSPNLFNHYMDEVKRMDGEIAIEWEKFINNFIERRKDEYEFK